MSEAVSPETYALHRQRLTDAWAHVHQKLVAGQAVIHPIEIPVRPGVFLTVRASGRYSESGGTTQPAIAMALRIEQSTAFELLRPEDIPVGVNISPFELLCSAEEAALMLFEWGKEAFTDLVAEESARQRPLPFEGDI